MRSKCRFSIAPVLPVLMLLINTNTIWGNAGLEGARILGSSADKGNQAAEYFVRPYTMVSEFGYPEETQITPEGNLRTHCGLLQFFIGPEREPVNQPVKELYKGHYPIISWQTEDNGLAYEWRVFSTTVQGTKKLYYKASTLNLRDEFKIVKIPNLFNFIEITVRNPTELTRPFWLGVSYELGSGIPMQVDYLSQEFIYFDWKGRGFRLSPDGFWFGDDKERLCFFKPAWEAAGEMIFQQGEIAPQETEALFMVLPYFPAKPADADIVSKLEFGQWLQKKIDYWDGWLEKMVDISLPEKKPLNVFYSSIMYLIEGHIDRIGKCHILRGNPFQYDQFYIRDGTHLVRAFDLAGLHQVARQCLQHFLLSQEKSGRFASQRTQHDANGMALYAIGQHYELTRDKAWARQCFPQVKKSMDWLYNYREGDTSQKGLMPAGTMDDNEQVANAHIVGHNLWALAGMEKAILIAQGAGEEETGKLWQRQHEQYLEVVKTALAETARKTGGFITPAFEGNDVTARIEGRFGKKYGFDWGNLVLVYPTKVLNGFNPMVGDSLSYWHQFLQEGLFPYPENGDENLLHHYLTIDITQTHLIRGECQEVLRQFYEGLLQHTTNTNAGCERLNRESRDFQPPTNITPHGTFAAKYVELLRNMLVREEGKALHLMSCLSPTWCEPGSEIRCYCAPTVFGKVSFKMGFNRDGGHLQIAPPRHSTLDKIVVHLPEYLELQGIVVDGQPTPLVGNTLELAPSTHSVDFKWEIKPQPSKFRTSKPSSSRQQEKD